MSASPVVRPMPGIALAPAGIWCCELELAEDGHLVGLSEPEPSHTRVRVLARLHGEPLGYLTENMGPVDSMVADLRRQARHQFGPAIRDHLSSEGILAHTTLDRESSADPLPPPALSCPNHIAYDDGLVSVVVCTRNRSTILGACLERLAQLTYAELEIVVVDNAPSDDSTQNLVEARAERDPRFRYVREPRPGLSVARNRGLREVRGTFVAYTDDDVAVDCSWIQGLLRGFHSAPHVGCVTGLVCTASIGTAAEAYFDARSPSWSSRCEPEIFDLAEHRRESTLYPYSAGIYGTGANFAFRRDVLLRVGDFDEALGAGTATKGGEDLDMFVRVLLEGGAIVYQPAAVVWHHHRSDDDELLSQMFGYGTGLSAYVTKCILRRSTRWDVLRRLPTGLLRMADIRRDTEGRMNDVKPPKRAWAREVSGFVAGPWLYAQARRTVRRADGPGAVARLRSRSRQLRP